MKEVFKDSEEIFRLAFVKSGIGKLVTDINGHFLQVNRSLCRIFGYTENEMLAMDMSDITYPDDIEESIKNINNLIEGKFDNDIFTMEKRYKKKDRSILHGRINVALIKDKDGKPYRMIGEIEDFTQIKKIEEVLKESQEKFRSFYEHASIGMVMGTLQGVFYKVNPSFCKMFGYSIGEFLGMKFSKITYPDDWQSDRKDLDRLIKGEIDCIQKEKRYIHKNGKIIWGLLNLAVVRDINLKPKNFIAQVQDISDKKQIEEALKKSEEKFRTIANQLPVGVYRTTEKGDIVFANPALASILQYDTIPDLMQRNVIDHFADKNERKDQLKEWNNKNDIVSNELRFFTKNGEEIWIRDTGRSVTDENGNIYYDGIIENITERRYAEEQIKTSLREKEILLKEIYHRVKNNLAVITSLLRLQSKYVRDEYDRKFFQDSQNRIRSMALIHEKLYKSENMAEVDFKDYIKTTTEELFRTYRVTPQKISLEHKVEKISLPINLAIPCGLIINELVTNSIKYAFPPSFKKNGKITVGLERVGDDELKLFIKDNGVGIPADFDIKNAESLGLRLVNILAEDQLKGRIKFERDKGISFIIFFKTIRD